MRKIISKEDIFVILIVLVFFALILFIRPFAGGSNYVEIKTPSGTWLYPLSQDRVLEVDGLIGKSTVVIENSSVFFKDSPCPGKNCMAEGRISKAGAFCACLPNGISITITGDTEVDDVSI